MGDCFFKSIKSRGTETLTILGILLSFDTTLILSSFNNTDIQLFLPILLVLSMNINSPIRKLLVLINQCLIYFYLQFSLQFLRYSSRGKFV